MYDSTRSMARTSFVAAGCVCARAFQWLVKRKLSHAEAGRRFLGERTWFGHASTTIDLNTGAWSTREWSTSARSKLVRTMACGCAEKKGHEHSVRAADGRVARRLFAAPHAHRTCSNSRCAPVMPGLSARRRSTKRRDSNSALPCLA
jgi:hypothetical protein